MRSIRARSAGKTIIRASFGVQISINKISLPYRYPSNKVHGLLDSGDQDFVVCSAYLSGTPEGVGTPLTRTFSLKMLRALRDATPNTPFSPSGRL